MTAEDKKLLDYAEHITDHLIHGVHVLNNISPIADEPAISPIASEIYNNMDNTIEMLIRAGLMLKQSVANDAFNNYVKNY